MASDGQYYPRQTLTLHHIMNEIQSIKHQIGRGENKEYEEKIQERKDKIKDLDEEIQKQKDDQKKDDEKITSLRLKISMLQGLIFKHQDNPKFVEPTKYDINETDNELDMLLKGSNLRHANLRDLEAKKKTVIELLKPYEISKGKKKAELEDIKKEETIFTETKYTSDEKLNKMLEQVKKLKKLSEEAKELGEPIAHPYEPIAHHYEHEAGPSGTSHYEPPPVVHPHEPIPVVHPHEPIPVAHPHELPPLQRMRNELNEGIVDEPLDVYEPGVPFPNVPSEHISTQTDQPSPNPTPPSPPIPAPQYTSNDASTQTDASPFLHKHDGPLKVELTSPELLEAIKELIGRKPSQYELDLYMRELNNNSGKISPGARKQLMAVAMRQRSDEAIEKQVDPQGTSRGNRRGNRNPYNSVSGAMMSGYGVGDTPTTPKNSHPYDKQQELINNFTKNGMMWKGLQPLSKPANMDWNEYQTQLLNGDKPKKELPDGFKKYIEFKKEHKGLSKEKLAEEWEKTKSS